MAEDVSFKGPGTSGPNVGATLGDYRLEQLIEKSALGTVFLARHKATGTMQRLRILPIPADLTSEERIVYLGRFQQQANQVAELQHPSILPLLDYGTHQGIPYLVYPHLPMKPLNAYLAQHGPTDVLLIGRYLDHIAEALEYALQHAVLHRNLTTDCIFLKQDGNLVVTDVGTLHLLAQKDGQKDSLYGMNETSAPAPEQVLGHPVDAYTDMYALGAALYRMLTGHRVFRGRTLDEIAQQHLNAPVPSLSQWRGDLPRALDTVIAKAMAKDPRQRFRQPGALANAYHHVVAPKDEQRKPFALASPQLAPINVMPAAVPVQSRASRQTHISRRQALTFLVAGGTAAVAIAAAVVFGSRYLAGSNAPGNTAVSTGTTTATKAPAPTPTSASTSTASGSTPTAAQGTVLAHVADVPLNSAKPFALPNGNNPGLLIHLSNDQFVAFNSTCTHAGCAVHYNQQDKLLECPCHGAAFDPAKNAAVTQGPAQSPLAPIQITVNADGTIVENGS